MSKALRWILGGAVGGLVGAILWAVVAHFTHREVGWVAWILGVLVGLGVRIAAGDDDGLVPGVVAALIAMLAVFGGKYLAVSWAVHRADLRAVVGDVVGDDEAVAALADKIAAQWTSDGKTLAWPDGKGPGSAAALQDYPGDVVVAARKTWADMPPTAQQNHVMQLQKERDRLVKEVKGALRSEGYKQSASLFDILWILLAVGSAYKLGAGSSSEG